MIIDTDIRAISEDGIEENIRCHSPEELLQVMKVENVTSCHIAVDSMGMNLLNTKVNQADVSNWIKKNKEG